MNYSFSKHAKEQISRRQLSYQKIATTIEEPDKIIVKEQCVKVFQKGVIENNIKYLYRVFINHCKEPSVVITCYKTSKTGKYED